MTRCVKCNKPSVVGIARPAFRDVNTGMMMAPPSLEFCRTHYRQWKEDQA